MTLPFLSTQVGMLAGVSLRARSRLARLKWSDPAPCAMTDFLQEPPLTLSEDVSVDEALDQMFRLGVRSFLVLRDRAVAGLMTAIQATRAAHHRLRVGDVMTPTDEMPAIDWSTLAEARIADLVEIFEGTGVHHLTVLESHSATLVSVRGLVNRDRLARQLASPWSLRQ